MPDNLTDEDLALQRANTIRETASRLPGVGLPGSTPATDEENLRMASALDRGDAGVPVGGFQSAVPTTDVFRAQRSVPDMIGNAIESRRAALAQGLATRTDPDAPAVYVGPKRHQQMLEEFNLYNNAAHENALTQATGAHENFVREQNIRSAQDFTGMAHDLASIPFDVGTPEHEKAVLGVVASHPFGAQTAAGKELLTTHAKIHDSAAQLSPEDKNYWQNYKQSFRDASEFARNAGVDVQFDDQGNPSIELTRARAKDAGLFVKPGANAKDPLTEELYKGYKLTPGQILNPVEVKAGNVVNGVFKPANDGNVYQVDAGGPTKVRMPKAAFERFQQGFAPAKEEDADTELTPAMKLNALALKALDDPNAPENVKAAARKRLGK